MNIIFNVPKWQITSYGNGLIYLIKDLEAERSILLQGDDALAFRRELNEINGREWGDICEDSREILR